ncbi:MAG: enoyl-CoA hydratase/isomerase family protein [Hyphomicrobiaceae bacterium]
MSETKPEEILIRREGRAGRITLDRPKALNALTYPQVTRIAAALAAWRTDPAVELIVLDATGGKALCAGGDVRAMYDARVDGSGYARDFWRDEYILNATIACYPKPYVALMDGIVMGGGIGLSGHASHRVVTERSMLAMPETTIGLIPDVGGTWLLAHAPGETGVYLGLIGARMDAADAIYARFADAMVPSDKLGELVARLVAPGPTAGEVIRALAVDPGPSRLAARRAEIDRLFAAPSVEEIRAALGRDDSDTARSDAAALDVRSPKSLKLTLAAIRAARNLPAIEAALRIEYRLTVRLYEDGEFIEGVRAQIVDKDKSPKWQPPHIEDVSADLIAAYLAPLPDGRDLGI